MKIREFIEETLEIEKQMYSETNVNKLFDLSFAVEARNCDASMFRMHGLKEEDNVPTMVNLNLIRLAALEI